jgi:hypothetical protein
LVRAYCTLHELDLQAPVYTTSSYASPGVTYRITYNDIYIVDLSSIIQYKDQLDTAVNQIGKNVIGVQGDVSNLADLDRLYAAVREKKGHGIERSQATHSYK